VSLLLEQQRRFGGEVNERLLMVAGREPLLNVAICLPCGSWKTRTTVPFCDAVAILDPSPLREMEAMSVLCAGMSMTTDRVLTSKTRTLLEALLGCAKSPPSWLVVIEQMPSGFAISSVLR
jgi:hypothetical protein